MLLNPYICGQPVTGEYFFGREEELQWLKGRIVESAYPQPCAVIGETRIGKTSLLRTFKSIASRRSDLLIQYYDVSITFKKTGDAIDFYRQFVNSIAEGLEKYSFVYEKIPKVIDERLPMGPLIKHIKSFFRSIHKTGYWLVLILDEFNYLKEILGDDPTGWHFLRELGSNEDYGICYVLGSSVPLEQLEPVTNISSTLAGLFAAGTIHLKLMSPPEATMLIDTPMKRRRLSWPTFQRDLALNVGGSHPELLQMTCSYLFQRMTLGTLGNLTNEIQLIQALRAQYKLFFSRQRERLVEHKLFDILLKLAHGVPVDASGSQIEELVNLGYLLQADETYEHFRPISLAQDFYLRACGCQVTLWPKVETTVNKLQRLVEDRYRSMFGQAWQDEVDRCTKENGANTNMTSRWEETRKYERSNPFIVFDKRNSLIHYANIADLKELIKYHPELFQDIFPLANFGQTESALDVLQKAISTEARYRRIGETEASYVENCCDMLLAGFP